jgi:hypothetical protein
VALTNWAGNLTYRAAAVRHPRGVEEVQDLVARLPRVRALGDLNPWCRSRVYPGRG